jgi:hypothetical protein
VTAGATATLTGNQAPPGWLWAVQIAVLAAMPNPVVLGGVLARRLGTATSLLVLAGLMLAVALAATAARSVRNAPQVESLRAELM